MLLQRLIEYSNRLDLPPTLYAEVPVRYVIDLRADGTPIGITDTADTSSRATRRGVKRLMPLVKRAYAIRPLLMADNGEYTLRRERAGSKADRVGEAHSAYRQMVSRCAAATKAPSVLAVDAFLADPSRLELPPDFDPAGIVTFRMDGQFVADLPSVQAFWAADNAPDNTLRMQCLICGHMRPVLARLQVNIKGGLIPGGQTSGTALISANADAFESYGLAASLTAPTCSDCGERFTKALNALLADERTHLRFGDGSVIAFWTREAVGWNFATLFEDPTSADAKAFLESIHAGRPRVAVDPNRFYAVVLSAAGGRAVVREWIDVSLPEAEAALARWFRRQAVIDTASGNTRYSSLRALAAATVRDLRDISPPTTRTLLRTALVGAPLPADMLAAAVRRARVEQRVTASQASLIKIVLASRVGHEAEEDSMVQLQPEHPSAGYQCGRLLAVLEAVQRAALPGVKAGIVDRYFGSASSAPAQVFPRLVKGAQPHLGRLERDRPAWQVALQRQLEEVLGHITTFPRILTLEEQGYFALGYYHQRADDAARRRAAAERRRAGTASATEEAEAALAERIEPTDQ